MTAISGTVRSYGAVVRKVEREKKRLALESAKRLKEEQKLQEIENVLQEVSVWENYIETIQTLHKSCSKPIDWNQIKNTLKPTEPQYKFLNVTSAQNKLDNFKPSFLDKVFGETQKKVGKLESLLEQAKLKDIKENNLKCNAYSDALKKWDELQKIAIGIEKKETESYKGALHYFKPFSCIEELGTQVSYSFENNYINIDLHINSLETVPDYGLKQTARGKLSKKNMLKGKFNELYQAHVCSAAIRAAREVFSYLPINYARVNALVKIVNTKNGQLEEQTILSVLFTPQIIESLNLETIDSIESMQNLVHTMKFNRIRGFSIVRKVVFKK